MLEIAHALPGEPDVIAMLFTFLDHRDGRLAIRAARALATHSSVNGVATRLVDLAERCDRPLTRALALVALRWSATTEDTHRVDRATDAAFCSGCPELVLAATWCRVKRGGATLADEHVDLALSALQDYSGALSGLSALGHEILLEGDSQSTGLREHLLDCAKDGHFAPYEYPWINSMAAADLLIRKYPDDPDVEGYVLGEFTTDRPLIGHQSGLYAEALVALAGNERIRAAAESHLLAQERLHLRLPGALSFVGLAPTQRVRRRLEREFDDLPWWTSHALLQFWGDEDAKARIRQRFLGSDLKAASHVAHDAARLGLDEHDVRRRLLLLLGNVDAERVDFVLQGIAALGPTAGDVETVDLALERLETSPDRRGTVQLISNYAWEPRVEAIALHQLSQPTHRHSRFAIPMACIQSENIRRVALESMSPLPGSLRTTVAERLSAPWIEPALAVEVTSRFAFESDPATSAAAARTWCSRHSDPSLAAVAIGDALSTYGGMDGDVALGSGLTAALHIGRPDLFSEARVGWRNGNPPLSLSYGVVGNTNEPLAQDRVELGRAGWAAG